MLYFVTTIVTTFIVNTVLLGQNAPVIQSKKSVSFLSELTVAESFTTLKGKGPEPEPPSTKTSWYEYTFKPGQGDVIHATRKITRATMEGHSVLGTYRIDTDSPFANNTQETMLLNSIQARMQKPATFSMKTNQPQETTNDIPLRDEIRLPVARNFFFNSFCLNRIPDAAAWVDTLTTADEIYENRFWVTNRAAGSVTLTLKGNRVIDKKGTEHFSGNNQKVDRSKAMISNQLDKDTYSGSMVVESATGIIISADVTRYQETSTNFSRGGFTVGLKSIYKIVNKRL